MLVALLFLFTCLCGGGAARPKEETEESEQQTGGSASNSSQQVQAYHEAADLSAWSDFNRLAVSSTGKLQRAGSAKRDHGSYALITAELSLTGRESVAPSALIESSQNRLRVLRANDPSPLEERKDEIRSLGIFWGIVWTVIILLYLASILLQKSDRPDKFTRPFKIVAAKFHRDPLLSQLVCTSVLFGIADILAQQIDSYHEVSNIAHNRFHGWDFRCTLAVVGSSCLFQAVILQRLYLFLDARLGHPTTLMAAVIKSLQMTLAFSFVYLPFAVFLYAVVVGFSYRTLADATDNCGPSALVGIPWNLMGSMATSGKLWQGDYLQAVVFWPPSHVVNYVLVQRWEPNIRPAWDGVVVLLWNAFVLGGGAEREAVGPMLFGPIPGPEGDKEYASVDCEKFSFTAMATWMKDKFAEYFGWIWRGIAAKIEEGAHRLNEKFKEGMHWTGEQIRNSWHNFKLLMLWIRQHFCASCVFLFEFTCWFVVEAIWLATYLFMLALTGARCGGYFAFEIMKGFIKIILTIVDYWRACMAVFFWMPNSEPLAEGCFYCELWPGDGSWPHQVAGDAPNYTDWVRPFSPEQY